VLFQDKVKISPTTTAGELHDDLMIVGAQLILRSVKQIESGDYELKPQAESEAIHAPKIFKETCLINWNHSVESIYNLIRGLSPYPAAFTMYVDKNNQSISIKLFTVEKECSQHQLHIGAIESDSKTFLKVACSNGFIHIKELQMAGKKRMLIEEFLRGFKVFPELAFSS
jgi:methionyl-tRNA formyltransferase